MENKLKLTTSIHVNAPKAVVWDALINPVQVKKYFFGTDLKSDWKPGSPITFSGEWEGKPYQDKGTVLAFEPEKMLQYNYWSNFSGTEDIPANYANITYEVADENGGTKLSITQDGFKDEAAKEHSEKNWQMLMDGLKKLVEA